MDGTKLENTQQPEHYASTEHTACLNHAQKNFDAYNNPSGQANFPVFWRLLGPKKNYQENYQAICSFFCKMQGLLEDQATTESVFKHLDRRLKSRWEPNRQSPLPTPDEILGSVENLSKVLLAELQKLEKRGLVSAAFELFAAGALTISRPQHLEQSQLAAANRQTNDIPPFTLFEPDSGAFFLWAEFGLVAAQAGFGLSRWKKILPIFFRSERIFALCYGQPQNGVIPPERRLSEYGGVLPHKFNTIHPDDTQSIPLKSFKTLEELEAEATDCAKFAFPKEFEVAGITT